MMDEGLQKLDGKLDRLIESVHAFRLETATRFGAIDARFGAIEGRLAKIEGAVENKASNAEVADLRSSVRSLPTIRQSITVVFGILAGAFAIARFGLPHP